jgi:hypothetical protein
MSKRRKILLGLLAGLVLLSTLLLIAVWHTTGDMTARQTLDHVLGQSQPSLPDLDDNTPLVPLEDTSPVLPDDHGGSFFGLPLPIPQASVKVQETADSYILRIPLADPKDASSIKLNVTPNRIEVSGQTGTKENGASVTSSFMQSFTTSQEVLPGQITRKTEPHGNNTDVVITIPKKQRGATNDNNNPAPEMQPDSTPALPQDNNDMPPAPPNPLDGVENKVI